MAKATRPRSILGRRRDATRRPAARAILARTDALESRRLLSGTAWIGPAPAALAPTAPMLIGPVAPIVAPVTPGPGSLRAAILAHLADGPPGGPAGSSPAAGVRSITLIPQPASSATNAPIQMVAAPVNPTQFGPVAAPQAPQAPHGPAMAGVLIDVDGQPVPEIATADGSAGSVTVVVGSQAVFTVTGLSHPAAVKLADLNNDGTPDLIIADSGHDRILVYAGQAGGGFGAELGGGNGFAVGTDPVGLTIGDINRDGLADLLVADRGSNDVTILSSRGSGPSWTLTTWAKIGVGLAPIRTALVDPPDGGGGLDLLVCNAGSGDVSFYRTSPDGKVDATPYRVISVGRDPAEMLLGQFGRRHELDMVTLSEDSDRINYVGDIYSTHPIRQEIAVGIGNLTSALMLSVDVGESSDLMVTNGSGQIAYLQATDVGLTLAGLSSPVGLSQVGAIALGTVTSDGFVVYEASSGSDSLALLQFGLGESIAKSESPPAAALPTVVAEEDDPLVVELVPDRPGSLDLAGFLWNIPKASATADLATDRAAPPRGRVAGQGRLFPGSGDDSGDMVEASSRSETPDGDADEAASSWTSFVFGLDAAMESFRGEVALIARDDADRAIDRSTERSPVDLAGLDDAAPRLVLPGATATVHARPDRLKLRPAGLAPRQPRGFLEEGRAASGETSELAAAVLGSGVAVRLLINASPPRPPRAGGKPRREVRWPEIVPPTGPHG